jgi:hypothetical protein
MNELGNMFQYLWLTLKTCLEAIRDKLPFSQELSYEEAMKYFIAHKDDKAEIVKGVIIKETVKEGFLVYQVFLDKNNQPVDGTDGRPLGCKRTVSRLDKELLDAFGTDDLIIVE